MQRCAARDVLPVDIRPLLEKQPGHRHMPFGCLGENKHGGMTRDEGGGGVSEPALIHVVP